MQDIVLSCKCQNRDTSLKIGVDWNWKTMDTGCSSQKSAIKSQTNIKTDSLGRKMDFKNFTFISNEKNIQRKHLVHFTFDYSDFFWFCSFSVADLTESLMLYWPSFSSIPNISIEIIHLREYFTGFANFQICFPMFC